MFNPIAKVKKAKKIAIRSLQSKILANEHCYRATDFLVADNTLLGSLSDYRHIYIDVSIFAKNDNKTGIQRVVREVIFQLLSDNEIKNKLRFVVATKSIVYHQVNCQIIDDKLHFEFPNKKNSIEPTKQDLFFGLDFCPNIVPLHLLTFVRWKKQGVKFAWILYDLLPVHYPEWFTDNIKETFTPWLNTILLLSDVVLCISNTVKYNAQNYANKIGIKPNLTSIRLGYGFSDKQKNNQNDSTEFLVKSALNNKSFVLMVGTLEPRKGHLQIVSALQDIWDNTQSDVVLVMIGQKGWGVDELLDKISNRKYQDKLIWLNSADDDLLNWLYQHSLGVIVASYDEGYGLPLMEAIAYNKHILVRDIEIFREVAENRYNISYFNDSNLQASMIDWLINRTQGCTQLNLMSDIENKGWSLTLRDIKTNILN